MAHELHNPILKELGLNASEAIVYELLLEMGPRPAQDLIDPSGLGRGNLYNVLKSLVEKQLIIEEVGKKTLYRVVDPEALRNLAQSRRRAADTLVSQLEATLPSFKSQFRLITKQPTVRLFEGIEGIQNIYRETLADKKEIFALVGPDAPAPELYTWLTRTYVKQRVASGIHASVVLSGKKEQTEKYFETSTAELRTATMVDGALYPFNGEINIFGDKVAFIAYRADELIGVILESPTIAETLRSVVRILVAAAPSSAPSAPTSSAT